MEFEETRIVKTHMATIAPSKSTLGMYSLIQHEIDDMSSKTHNIRELKTELKDRNDHIKALERTIATLKNYLPESNKTQVENVIAENHDKARLEREKAELLHKIIKNRNTIKTYISIEDTYIREYEEMGFDKDTLEGELQLQGQQGLRPSDPA